MPIRWGLALCLIFLLKHGVSENENENNAEENYMKDNTARNCSKFEGFVVGGSYASIDTNPHSAFLTISCHIKNKKMERYGCGGSIINQVIVLSAAHCLANCLSGSHIGITIGAEHKFQGLNFSAQSFIRHPKYNFTSLANDISLIKSKQRFAFGSKVKRVVIMRNPPKYKQALIAGWGLVNEKQRISTLYLKAAKQNILSRHECLTFLPDMPVGAFCAKALWDAKEHGYAAKGDSGSGLIVNGYILIGVVSYKNRKLATTTAVYTDVAYYFDWIRGTAKQLYCSTNKI